MNDIYKSATFKLTAWYLVLLTAISLIFSGVVYHFATDALAQGLSSQQARIYQAFPVFSGNRFFIHDNDIQYGSHTILRNLVYFNIVMLIGAGFASYWLARRTLKPIQASNERQKRFVADASHELRTPLTSLKMSTEVALLDPNLPKTELREVLQSNLEDADKLTNLINSLLRMSQVEKGEIRRSFILHNASDIITEAISAVSKRASDKYITIENTCTAAPLAGERDSLVQLFVILLDNAIKYSPQHTGISVRSGQSEHSTMITISDQGEGIKADALQHVFDRFYRADSARTGSEGFGLGLSIAKNIADLHDGIITIHSRPGKGTVVEVSLPKQV